MRTLDIMGPGLATALAPVFNRRAQIQQKPLKPARRPSGAEVIGGWAPVPGLEAIPAHVTEPAGSELKATDYTEELNVVDVVLAGYIPSITPRMRVYLADTEEVLDILNAGSDALQALTWLACRRIKPAADQGA
ncbi:MAG: hypothetical protein M3O87_08225 [Candidatus Dormibacteraeota bacterium]|nr:hypothetical protein [Candidatus Dormibacteraeota bacterium]